MHDYLISVKKKSNRGLHNNIDLNVSKEACKPFGFFYNERVQTPFGPGTVMGVAEGRCCCSFGLQLFFLLDKDDGVSFWGGNKEKEFKEQGFARFKC